MAGPLAANGACGVNSARGSSALVHHFLHPERLAIQLPSAMLSLWYGFVMIYGAYCKRSTTNRFPHPQLVDLLPHQKSGTPLTLPPLIHDFPDGTLEATSLARAPSYPWTETCSI